MLDKGHFAFFDMAYQVGVEGGGEGGGRGEGGSVWRGVGGGGRG